MTFTQRVIELISKADFEQLCIQHKLPYTFDFLKEIPSKMEDIFYVDVDNKGNCSFLDSLPEHAQDEVAQELFVEVFIYLTNPPTEKWNELGRKLHRTERVFADPFMCRTNTSFRNPQVAINKDLKTMRAFQEILDRLNIHVPYSSDAIDDMAFRLGHDVTLEDITTTSKVLHALINDLETKRWKVIQQDSYYETPLPSKNRIKQLLKTITKKYQVKSVSQKIKEFIDAIK